MKRKSKNTAHADFDLDAFSKATQDFIKCTAQGRQPGAKTRKELAKIPSLRPLLKPQVPKT
ncbi:MAG: hypothetical protein ACAH80_00840 [Alphaproteobacteria bacterium]